VVSSLAAGPCEQAYPSLEEAKAACVSAAWPDCSGVTFQGGVYQLRAGDSLIPNEGKSSFSYRISNLADCKPGRKPPYARTLSHTRARARARLTHQQSLVSLSGLSVCASDLYVCPPFDVISRHTNNPILTLARLLVLARYNDTIIYAMHRPAPVPAIDPVWHARAQGAYGAVARADGPEARWLLQGWMLLIRGQGFGPPGGDPDTERGPLALSRLKAFATAAPPGK
jgi:hypothetical protein